MPIAIVGRPGGDRWARLLGVAGEPGGRMPQYERSALGYLRCKRNGRHDRRRPPRRSDGPAGVVPAWLRQEELLAGGKGLHQRDQMGPDSRGRIAGLGGAAFPQRVDIPAALPACGAVALQENLRGPGELSGGCRPDEIRDLFPPVPLDLIPVLAHLLRILERRGPDEQIQSVPDLVRDRVLDRLPKLPGPFAGRPERLREGHARLAPREMAIEFLAQPRIHRPVAVVRKHVREFLAIHGVTPPSPPAGSGRAARAGKDGPGAGGT